MATKLNQECRICGGERLEMFLDLGETPLANAFLREPYPDNEPRYKLDVYFCHDCGLVQLLNVVSPEEMFAEYLYVSSTSDTLHQHFAGLAQELVERQQPWQAGDLAVEIASNDGILMRQLRNLGVEAIGVEPAANLAMLTRQDGFKIVNDFYNLETAKRMRDEFGPARIITGSNVMGHVDNLRDFFAGLEHLLADDGLVCMEVPHLLELIKGTEFDTIYHEHLSYFSLHAIERLCSQTGFSLVDAEPMPVHGGTIRSFIRKAAYAEPRSRRLEKMLAKEERAGLIDPETYRHFGARVEDLRTQLLTVLNGLRLAGYRIAGYGAAAKGNTLLNYCGIGRDQLDYIVDKNPLKQGLYTPGASIPVKPVEELMRNHPDYVLILAWNFADEIVRQQDEYKRSGGRFIIPLTEFRVLDHELVLSHR